MKQAKPVRPRTLGPPEIGPYSANCPTRNLYKTIGPYSANCSTRNLYKKPRVSKYNRQYNRRYKKHVKNMKIFRINAFFLRGSGGLLAMIQAEKFSLLSRG